MAYTTIDKPTDYFNTKLHTGDGGGSGSSTGIGFQPDMVWSKSRTEALNHTLFDSVRGAGSNKELTPNGTSPEGGADSAGFGYISAFNSDGYSWTAGSTNTENFNKSSQTYANWCWKAGTSFTNDASATSIGSIDSAGSTSTTAGFSIVSYTGTGSAGTIAHNLGVAPKMILAKSRDASENWVVFHKSLNSSGAGTYIYLNTTAAAAGGGSNTSIFNNTAPTSSVFSIGNDGNINNSSDDYIAYCFAEKKGFSKFGSYTGNGNVDGTFVYTGFKPAMIIIKKNGAGDNWHIYDNKVNPTNVMDTNLRPNLPAAEITNANHNLDFVSNGFKWRTTSNTRQGSGSEVIYMAFAESPFVTSTGIPTTAR